MANLKELLQEMVTGSEEHRWKGITPQSVALIFVRHPEKVGRSHLGEQALVSNSYPLTQSDANEYGERFCEPMWQYLGLVFAYRHPEGTQFEAHPDPEISDEEWIHMMKAPVAGTGLTYKEKIICRLTGLSYQEYLALKKEEGDPTSSEELRLSPESLEARMKNTRLEDLPKHKCAKPGNPSLGFAPLDFDVMKQLADRDASKEELGAQVNAWIAADAAKNPNPTEPEEKRFQAALYRNNPFAVYCRLCRQLLCLIHPEQVANATAHLTPTENEEATDDRVQQLRSELENLGRWGIVSWNDGDIVEALENAGVDPSSANITAVREHFSVQHIDDRMTEVGCAVIEEAINDLGLVPPGAPDKTSE